MAQADIETFQGGIFIVAVGGEVWGPTSSTVSTPPSARGPIVWACTIRKSIHDYSVAVNGRAWSANYALRLAALLSSRNR
jgi:hypothetical protein